jgi:hypothetical protein
VNGEELFAQYQQNVTLLLSLSTAPRVLCSCKEISTCVPYFQQARKNLKTEAGKKERKSSAEKEMF